MLVTKGLNQAVQIQGLAWESLTSEVFFDLVQSLPIFQPVTLMLGRIQAKAIGLAELPHIVSVYKFSQSTNSLITAIPLESPRGMLKKYTVNAQGDWSDWIQC